MKGEKLARIVEQLLAERGISKGTFYSAVGISATTLYGSINGLCEAVGLPLVGVHGLRHSFASLAYHLKWSEATTMYEGGWSDQTVVHRIYTHLANQDANKDVKKMQKFYEKQGKHSAKVR